MLARAFGVGVRGERSPLSTTSSVHCAEGFGMDECNYQASAGSQAFFIRVGRGCNVDQ